MLLTSCNYCDRTASKVTTNARGDVIAKCNVCAAFDQDQR